MSTKGYTKLNVNMSSPFFFFFVLVVVIGLFVLVECLCGIELCVFAQKFFVEALCTAD